MFLRQLQCCHIQHAYAPILWPLQTQQVPFEQPIARHFSQHFTTIFLSLNTNVKTSIRRKLTRLHFCYVANVANFHICHIRNILLNGSVCWHGLFSKFEHISIISQKDKILERLIHRRYKRLSYWWKMTNTLCFPQERKVMSRLHAMSLASSLIAKINETMVERDPYKNNTMKKR